jgi:hypothetical protein
MARKRAINTHGWHFCTCRTIGGGPGLVHLISLLGHLLAKGISLQCTYGLSSCCPACCRWDAVDLAPLLPMRRQVWPRASRQSHRSASQTWSHEGDTVRGPPRVREMPRRAQRCLAGGRVTACVSLSVIFFFKFSSLPPPPAAGHVVAPIKSPLVPTKRPRFLFATTKAPAIYRSTATPVASQ